MADTYYIDFPVTVYQTFTIKAESEDEARAIAASLWHSESFYYDFIHDDFDGTYPENVGKPFVSKCNQPHIRASLDQETLNMYMMEG